MSIRFGPLAVAVAVVFGLLAGCSGDDDGEDKGDKDTQQPTVDIVARTGVVTGKLPKARAQKVADQVGVVVDTWVNAAYLDSETALVGSSHPGFTPRLTKQAKRDRAFTSSSSLDGKVDGVSVERKSVKVDIFTPNQKPAGATARFRVVLAATGEAEGTYLARGTLSLVPGAKGSAKGWKVFAYEAVTFKEMKK